MEPAGVCEQQILKLEQHIKSTGAAIGHCIASAAFLFVGLTVAFFASGGGQQPLTDERLVGFLAPALFAFLGVALRWYQTRLESELQNLTTQVGEQAEGIWPPAPQVPR